MFPGGGNVGIYPDNGVVRAAVIGHTDAHHHCLVFPQSAFQPEPALVNERVTVWCRDLTSQSTLSSSGTKTTVLIAFYMDHVIPKTSSGENVFYIKRTPGGDAETIDHGMTFPCPAADLTLAHSLDQIVATLKPFQLVISDKLHGGLITLMDAQEGDLPAGGISQDQVILFHLAEGRSGCSIR